MVCMYVQYVLTVCLLLCVLGVLHFVCRSLQDCEELPSQADHVRSVVEALWRVLAHSPSTVLPAPLSPLLKAMADLAARLLAYCDSGESKLRRAQHPMCSSSLSTSV